ncbi:MAG: YciI family protein [Acetobacteraceae bacterium]
MKFVNYAKYNPEKITALRPVHRAYAARLMAEGKLVTAGPLTDGSGGLFIYEAETLEEAEALVRDDPYTTGGGIASYELTGWTMVGANIDLLRPTTT